jgi:hypothetical protein
MSPDKGKATASEFLRRFIENLTQMPLSLGEGVSAKSYNWDHWLQKIPGLSNPAMVTTICLGVLGSSVLAGAGLLLARGQVLVPFYMLAYVAAVCLTPWPFQWTRYWAPLAPILALSLIVLLIAIRDRLSAMLKGRWIIAAQSCILVVIGILFAIESLTLFNFYQAHHQEVERAGYLGQDTRYRLFYYDNAYRDLDRALGWVKEHSNPEDILAASMPHWAYLQTGLKTVMPPFEKDPEKAQALLDSVPVRFVIVDKSVVDFARQYMVPLFKSSSGRWVLAYAEGNDEGLQVYRRISQSK